MTVSKRVGIHVLTAYPPSNPNRDETGQPKSAVVAGVTRQRISSQCIKRTWRLSESVRQLNAKFATRTRSLGQKVEERLLEKKVPEKTAREWAVKIAEVFGKVDKKNAPAHSEMVTIGHEEWEATMHLVDQLAASKKAPTPEELAALPRQTVSLDCALFGRMRAANPGLNVEASVSVSHPLTVGKSSVEADFWTSVDDLKRQDDDADRGSGGMGEVEYGSGTYYTYVEIDVDQLRKNLGDAQGLAKDALRALTKAIATASPGGHRTTFGNSVRASYMRAEIGEPSGNLYCAAFEKPASGTKDAIELLRAATERETKAFDLKQEVKEFSVPDGKGTLDDVLDAVAAAA
jgi:CRISPR system Cascade subunit CasC